MRWFLVAGKYNSFAVADMTTTAIDMDNIEYEVRKTTELIREMTVKLAERDKMQEQAEEQKKAVKQFTDQVSSMHIVH